MTSEERREARYQRRKAKRLANREARSRKVGTLSDVFSFWDMFYYGTKCCNGVRWKQSVQNFEFHLLSRTARKKREILTGRYKPIRCNHFTLCERGKIRPIDAPHITDRQVQKVINNKLLAPLYTPTMIYDNGASQKGKGLSFAFRRLTEQLHWHFRRYGREGGVLLIDLKQFFPSAPRPQIYQRHARYIRDEGLRGFADYLVHTCPSTDAAKQRGMPLGIEISQEEMVALPSAVDNYIKCQRGVHCASHYMDDYVIIHQDMETLKQIGRQVIRRFERMGIPVNKRKCKIIPLTKPFKFCKAKFGLTETGKVIVNRSRDSIKRARRKLKLFWHEWHQGKRSIFEIQHWFKGQISYYDEYNDHGRVLRLRRLYHALFIMGGTRQCIKSSGRMGESSAKPTPLFS